MEASVKRVEPSVKLVGRNYRNVDDNLSMILTQKQMRWQTFLRLDLSQACQWTLTWRTPAMAAPAWREPTPSQTQVAYSDYYQRLVFENNQKKKAGAHRNDESW